MAAEYLRGWRSIILFVSKAVRNQRHRDDCRFAQPRSHQEVADVLQGRKVWESKTDEDARIARMKRGELVERPNAHLYETGGMRRLRLRGRGNANKRLLIHAAAANLGLVMRKTHGFGTPRGLAAAARAVFAVLADWCMKVLWVRTPILASVVSHTVQSPPRITQVERSHHALAAPTSTAC